MAKDTVALLRRVLADEDAALAEGRVGTMWDAEASRFLPLIPRCWQTLGTTEASRLYAHVMRRTGRLGTTSPNAFVHLMTAYQQVQPRTQRIAHCFRFGYDRSGPLPSGIAEDGGELQRRHKVLERFRGHKGPGALVAKHHRFAKEAKLYGRPALEALRHTGWSEDDGDGGAPESMEAMGLVMLTLMMEPTRSDVIGEVRALEEPGERWTRFRELFEELARAIEPSAD